MRIDVDGKPRLCIHRNGRMAMIAEPKRGVGLTLHRAGGLSVVGFPYSGGTTIAFGVLKQRMDAYAENCTKRLLGPVGVYSGEDF